MNLPPVKQAVESLEQSGVQFQLFDDVRIEPTDSRYVDDNVTIFITIEVRNFGFLVGHVLCLILCIFFLSVGV